MNDRASANERDKDWIGERLIGLWWEEMKKNINWCQGFSTLFKTNCKLDILQILIWRVSKEEIENKERKSENERYKIEGKMFKFLND